MKVVEYFKKGDTVFVYTPNGIKAAKYIRLDGDYNGQNREVYVGGLENYRDQYGTVSSYQTFPERHVFSSKEAAAEFFLTGKREDLKPVAEHESLYNAGDKVYSLGQEGIEVQTVTHVSWRLGCFEYHSNAGGCAVYFERNPGMYFRTREEAVQKLLSL